MIIPLRKWVSLVLFLLLFAVLLWAAGGGYRWLTGVVSPLAPYTKPKGDAVKVFGEERSPEGGSAADRLRWFYWYGE